MAPSPRHVSGRVVLIFSSICWPQKKAVVVSAGKTFIALNACRVFHLSVLLVKRLCSCPSKAFFMALVEPRTDVSLDTPEPSTAQAFLALHDRFELSASHLLGTRRWLKGQLQIGQELRHRVGKPCNGMPLRRFAQIVCRHMQIQLRTCDLTMT